MLRIGCGWGRITFRTGRSLQTGRRCRCHRYRGSGGSVQGRRSRGGTAPLVGWMRECLALSGQSLWLLAWVAPRAPAQRWLAAGRLWCWHCPRCFGCSGFPIDRNNPTHCCRRNYCIVPDRGRWVNAYGQVVIVPTVSPVSRRVQALPARTANAQVPENLRNLRRSMASFIEELFLLFILSYSACSASLVASLRLLGSKHFNILKMVPTLSSKCPAII